LYDVSGTLTVEEVYKDRDQFAALVREVAAPDVGRMGIEILSFTIKDVYDEVQYLASLGKSQTAAVKRDADIGVAQANRDAGIRVRLNCGSSKTKWQRVMHLMLCVPILNRAHTMKAFWFGRLGRAPLFLTLALGGIEWSASRPDRFTPKKTKLKIRLCGPQHQPAHFAEEKNLLPMLGLEPQPSSPLPVPIPTEQSKFMLCIQPY
jgi:hypothetical protein